MLFLFHFSCLTWNAIVNCEWRWMNSKEKNLLTMQFIHRIHQKKRVKVSKSESLAIYCSIMQTKYFNHTILAGRHECSCKIMAKLAKTKLPLFYYFILWPLFFLLLHVMRYFKVETTTHEPHSKLLFKNSSVFFSTVNCSTWPFYFNLKFIVLTNFYSKHTTHGLFL